MADEKKKAQDNGLEETMPEDTSKERRDFLKKAGATVAAAPAVTLLLSAKAAKAVTQVSGIDSDEPDAGNPA